MSHRIVRQTKSNRKAKPKRLHTISLGVWAPHIKGRYRAISVHQLAMAWWCFQAGYITKRQLRVWFAAQEMLERRRYTAPPTNQSEYSRAHQAPRKPSYGLDELKSLVGGKGSKTADAALSADLKKLGSLGLVSITEHSITFATSIDQLCFDGVVDDLSSFWTMFNQLPHPRRRVPVPRRVLRALAGGFTSGMTAVVLATLIRSLFWHKNGHAENTGSRKGKSGGSREAETGEGAYRIDGRTKREWIAEVFGITPRTITDARARLIELGWLIPLETHQHLLNRYGTHDQINTEWNPSATTETKSVETKPYETKSDESNSETPSSNESGVKSGGDEGCNQDQNPYGGVGKSSTPSTEFSGGSSSLINRSTSSSTKKNLNTRRPAPTRAGPAGASLRSALKTKNEEPSKIKSGSRKKKSVSGRARVGLPNIRDIKAVDFGKMDRMLELHRQAVKQGLSSPSEAGKLSFLALAERAKTRGRRAGAMFYWLLRENKTSFITQHCEDEANRRLKEHLYGSHKREMNTQQWGSDAREDNGRSKMEMRGSSPLGSGSSKLNQYTKEDQFVIACIRVAKKHRIANPFRMAHNEGWTRDRWDTALASYEAKQWEQLQHARRLSDETTGA